LPAIFLAGLRCSRRRRGGVQVPYSLIVKVHTLRGEQSVPHMLKELHP